MRFNITLIVGIAAFTSLVSIYFYRTRSPCPSGLQNDQARASRIVRLLDATNSQRHLLANVPESLRICFDESRNGVLRTDGIAVLSKEASDSENAARLGHLLFHFSQKTAWPAIDLPFEKCKALVEDAIEVEAHAYRLENKLRKELQMDTVSDFDPALWKQIFEARCQKDAPLRQ